MTALLAATWRRRLDVWADRRAIHRRRLLNAALDQAGSELGRGCWGAR